MPTHIRLERANPATPAPTSNAVDRGNHRGTTIADNRPSSLLLGNRRHVNVTARICSSHDAGNVEIRLNLFVGRLPSTSHFSASTVLSFPFFSFLFFSFLFFSPFATMEWKRMGKKGKNLEFFF